MLLLYFKEKREKRHVLCLVCHTPVTSDLGGGRDGASPGVGELKVGDVEDPLAVGAIVIVHKLLQLHLAVLLLGDIGHVHAPLWPWGGRGGLACQGGARGLR